MTEQASMNRGELRASHSDRISSAIRRCAGFFALVSSILVAHPSMATDKLLRMIIPPAVVAGVAAMPRVADPADDAQRAINAAVARLDDKVRKAVADCRKQGGKDTDWRRGITITMRGPHFLSYEIGDSAFCGGAHPGTSTMSIVYDIQSGKPVDWTKLLPPALTEKLALADGMDGTKMVTLSSPTLLALYLTGYRHPSEGSSTEEDKDCREAVGMSDGSAPPMMMAWLDAKAGGLAVQFDLPHAVQGCADTVVIPADALKALGAQLVLTSAIAAAHDAIVGGHADK